MNDIDKIFKLYIENIINESVIINEATPKSTEATLLKYDNANLIKMYRIIHNWSYYIPGASNSAGEIPHAFDSGRPAAQNEEDLIKETDAIFDSSFKRRIVKGFIG